MHGAIRSQEVCFKSNGGLWSSRTYLCVILEDPHLYYNLRHPDLASGSENVSQNTLLPIDGC